jgi:hypothetical protein
VEMETARRVGRGAPRLLRRDPKRVRYVSFGT